MFNSALLKVSQHGLSFLICQCCAHGCGKLNGVVLSNLAYLSQCAGKQLTGSDADVIAVGLGRQPPFNSAPAIKPGSRLSF